MPISGNSPSSREACACTRPFDATKWRHQLQYTACPVNSCSAICLALGSRSRPGTLGTPSTASFRIGPRAPPESSGSGFSSLTSSDLAGNPPRTQTVASHQSCLLSASCRRCTRCSLCTQLYNRGIVNLSSPSGSMHRFSSQHSNLCGTGNLSPHKTVTHTPALESSNSEIGSPIVATFDVQSLARLDKFSSCCARTPLPVCDTLGPRRLSCTCVDFNLDPFRLSHFNSNQRRDNSRRIHRFQLLVQHLLVSSSQDCELPLHSWFCAFLSKHLCWCLSYSNSLSSSVRAFHSSNIQSNPCSRPCPCSCLVLVVFAVLAVLASLCLCPCHACPCLFCPCANRTDVHRVISAWV